MHYHIRTASSDDYNLLCDLYAQADQQHEALPAIFAAPAMPPRTREFLAERMTGDDRVLFVAEAEGTIAGLIEAYVYDGPEYPGMIARRTAGVMTVIVGRRWQRSGIGRALMGAAERWARDKGALELRLNVWEFNAGAIAFYEQLGFGTLRRGMAKALA